MSDDYGQFVALDIDIELEPIESFKIKMKPNIFKYKLKHNVNHIDTINYDYWYLLGLCIIMLF